MREAAIPFIATAAFAFAVYRWASDELGREQRLTGGAARAVVILFVMVSSLALVSALGGVGRFEPGTGLAPAVGWLLAGAGAGLVAAAARALGSRERLLGMRFDEVVSTGPYRYSRHPLYVGWIAALFGVALAGRSGAALAIAILVGASLLRLARSEEHFLAEQVGSDYDEYRQRTPALAGRSRR